METANRSRSPLAQATGALAKRVKRAAKAPLDGAGAAREDVLAILNSVPHVIWSAGPNGRVDYVSEQWAKVFGGQPNALLDDRWHRLVHPDDRRRAVATWRHAVRSGTAYASEFRLMLPNGKYRWIAVCARLQKLGGRPVKRWYGTCTDVHDRYLSKADAEDRELLYGSVLEASPNCIKVLSLDGRLQFMNGPGLRLLEIASIEQIKDRCWWDLWPSAMAETVKQAVATAAAGEKARFSGWCATAAGEARWWDVIVTPIRCSDGAISGILSISRDGTVERSRSEELLWASEHDALTALPNRRAFQKRLQAAVLTSLRESTPVGLLLIDLDHFKHVNDTLGHVAGDELLKMLSARLEGALGDGEFLARIGGDEFAVVVEHATAGEDLIGLGGRLAAALKSPLRVHGRAVRGGASIGAALLPDNASTAIDLLKAADTALYALKGEGRGGTKLYHPHMRDEAHRTASQLSLARSFLSEDTVRIHYQPQVALKTGQIVGVEALLRWVHPVRGLQLPDTIEEAFKDYELASRIGQLMQQRVLLDLCDWRALGIDPGRVSINAAPAEFLRDDYAERLLERIAERDHSPSQIEVEVTEHALMGKAARYVGRALDILKRAGVTIALDDFGTGHSSLSHLRDFPVDKVKIDRSFVARIGQDSEIAAIVSAVIGLANSLKLQCVAEGVETQLQADLLRFAGCCIGQGYLFGEPRCPDSLRVVSTFQTAA